MTTPERIRRLIETLRAISQTTPDQDTQYQLREAAGILEETLLEQCRSPPRDGNT